MRTLRGARSVLRALAQQYRPVCTNRLTNDTVRRFGGRVGVRVPCACGASRAGSAAAASISDATAVDCDGSCWKCEHQVECQELLCSGCGAPQSLGDVGYFALFDINVSFLLSTDELDRKLWQLQRALHPDRFANSTERELALSSDLSSRINAAYQTLHEPHRRAVYTLEVLGHPLPESEGHLVSDDYLENVMERRIEIDCADVASDEGLSVLRVLSDEAHRRLYEYLDAAEEARLAGDIDGMHTAVAQLQYERRLLSAARQRLPVE